MATVAIILDDDFEDSEFIQPVDALYRAGHDVIVVGVDAGACVYGKSDDTEVEIDVDFEDCSVDEFDALVIPGGFSPDHLRLDDDAVEFVRDFMASGKPVAAVCHGPQILITAGVVDGRRLTSWPSVRVDLENAGAEWVDEEVVVDGRLITSRKPEDLPAFSQALIDQIEEAPSHRPYDSGPAAPAN